MIGQVDVAGVKTNEPASARDLLETLDLDGRTVTADTLHTVKATAELIHARGGQFLFPVKENRRTLFDALNTLPWPRVPVAARHIDTSHGRITRRTIQVLPAPPGLPFPHVNQVWLIERYVTDTAGRHLSAAAQLGVASHTPEQATPAQIAAFNQCHWAIESLHRIRDTCYREDASRVRTRNGPRVLASMRNLAINALSELVCLAVAQVLLGAHSEAHWIRYARIHLAGMFPYLPQRPGYNKRHGQRCHW